MLDEITINGVLYKKVEDKKENRPVNFNPFDAHGDKNVWILPHEITPVTLFDWHYTNNATTEKFMDNSAVVTNKQVALSINFRCRIMRKLLEYGYETNSLWNGEGEAYTIGYSVNSYGVDFMVIPWKNMSDICSIAFNSQDACNDVINVIVKPEYMVAQRDNDKLYKKEEWI